MPQQFARSKQCPARLEDGGGCRQHDVINEPTAAQCFPCTEENKCADDASGGAPIEVDRHLLLRSIETDGAGHPVV